MSLYTEDEYESALAGLQADLAAARARIAELEAERDRLLGEGQALEDRVFELEAKLSASVAGENDEHREMRP